ncbi:hypothetical protein FF38_13693 [Lucilia cuprina]|uniref:Myb/SANT-like DNA-binding domain-containing protein n=1 Tax=Lucilia cuprina TaxID=7375 RepID=A0A0L0BY93_LUCCU|nr:uncharacterized protein LOC111683848 [Lucilia cuprina]KNC24249.1 hypothetical protein FF38_13693 [Lucilia cuprina]
MTDLQPNGEPKKIYLSKPSEQPAVKNEPIVSTSTPQYTTASTPQQWRSLRSCSADMVRIPPRRHPPPVDKTGEEHLSNHKKQRYWNSWEELYLVELWRRYKEELTVVNVPLPVYRKMMIAMRNRNMIVTAQDCRRKVNTLNTRYKQELQKMETSGCKSEWRLFPLIHCVLQPKIKEFDAWHEPIIIKKLLDKIPKPVEVETTASTQNHQNSNSHQYSAYQTRTAPTSTQVNSYQQRTYVSSALYTDANSPYNRLSSSQGRCEKSSILPFRNITMEKIEQLRQDNNRLAEQRDADLKSLHLEEENFRCFETFIRIWTEQKEMELRRVQLMSEQNVISIENEENQNVEQHQLHETAVTAK